MRRNIGSIRYDARGNGLSSREVDDISFDRFVDDLERVFDAAGVERAPIFALSQGCAIAIAFAARAPVRVSGLVMMGGFAVGRALRTQKGQAEAEALKAMIGAGWDDPYPRCATCWRTGSCRWPAWRSGGCSPTTCAG